MTCFLFLGRLSATVCENSLYNPSRSLTLISRVCGLIRDNIRLFNWVMSVPMSMCFGLAASHPAPS